MLAALESDDGDGGGAAAASSSIRALSESHEAKIARRAAFELRNA